MFCPICEQEQTRRADRCANCGAYLGMLKRQPQRIAYCVLMSILMGVALLAGLAWHVFAPLLRGWPPAVAGPFLWAGLGLGAFFLALGLTARSHLARALQRMLRNL